MKPVFRFISNYLSLVSFLILALKCTHITSEKTVRESVVEICELLISLDENIAKTLKELPKLKGELLIKYMQDYNNALTKIEQLLITHRNDTLECPKAINILKEGAPDYFHVNIDRETAMANFGWLDKGLNEVFQQRAVSITIWTRLNRRSRLIPLEFYSYPENTTYVGYESPIFPPVKEKMKKN